MKRCIVCGRELPERPLLVLDHAPASAQDIPDAANVEQDRGITLNLCQCESCGLVQFDCTPVSYYKDVIRAGGFSTTMTELRRTQYRHLIETYHLEGKRFLEAGCGRGEFLKVLKEFPVEGYGIEHKEDLVKIAREDGLAVCVDFAEDENRKLASELCPGPYDAFLSFNFLEHQPEPEKMLRAIWSNLSEDGMGLVTVPALEYILENGSYYELIRDHIAYYSFDTLRILLERCGFVVLEEEMINRDTISMIVRKGSMPRPEDIRPTGAEPVDMTSVQNGYHRIRQEVEALTGKLAIWGASHQGFTLAATTVLAERAAYIIDSAPFKKGKYAPASHLRIVAPEHYHQEPAEVILIVAPGYTDEIAGVIRQRFGSAVKILTLRTDHIEELG